VKHFCGDYLVDGNYFHSLAMRRAGKVKSTHFCEAQRIEFYAPWIH
jgi:hypothetical protein